MGVRKVYITVKEGSPKLNNPAERRMRTESCAPNFGLTKHPKSGSNAHVIQGNLEERNKETELILIHKMKG